MNEKPFSSDSPDAISPLSAQPISPAPIPPPTPAITTPAAVSLSKAETEAAPVAPNSAGNAPLAAPLDEPAELTPLEAAINSRNSGASWFFWIVGLSIINSLIIHFGGDTSFPLGLGSTLLIDLIAREESTTASLGTVLHSVALVLDFLIIGFFVLCGKKAINGASWAFVVGGILYTFDALLMLVLKQWLGIGLHAWALISLFAGYKANQAVKELQKTTVASPWSA